MPDFAFTSDCDGTLAPLSESQSGRSALYGALHYAMATMFSITVYGEDLAHLQASVSDAFAEIDRLESMLSHYRPDSEMSRINEEAFERAVSVSPEMFALLREAQWVSDRTAGAFDMTVGSLMKTWGFFERQARVPPEDELWKVLRCTGFRHVQLDPVLQSVRFDEAGVELDPGAIGKGYAVDRVVAMLRKKGIECALISGGTSSIYALGAPPGETGWKISICHPLDTRKRVSWMRLRDLSVSISGVYEKSFLEHGKLYGHILKPGHGEPADEILMSVVVAVSATRSDALSTAFFAGGMETARSYIESHSECAAILYAGKNSFSIGEEKMLSPGSSSFTQDRFAWSYA